jgi:hypothetical protein
MDEITLARYLSGEADPSEAASIERDLEESGRKRELEVMRQVWTISGPGADAFDVERIRRELRIRAGMASGSLPPRVAAGWQEPTITSRASLIQWVGAVVVAAAACGILYMRASGVVPRSSDWFTDEPAEQAVHRSTPANETKTPERIEATPRQTTATEVARSGLGPVSPPGASLYEVSTFRRFGGPIDEGSYDQYQDLTIPRPATAPRRDVPVEKSPPTSSAPAPAKGQRKSGSSSI